VRTDVKQPARWRQLLNAHAIRLSLSCFRDLERDVVRPELCETGTPWGSRID
jgi:hypothetical protein